MKISHVVHTSNGSHSLYLDNELRDLVGIDPGTHLSLSSLEDGNFILRYQPRNGLRGDDPVMAANRHIHLGNSSEIDALLGAKTADMELHVAHKGYVVFGSKPRVFSAQGEAIVKNLPKILHMSQAAA